MLGFRVCCLGFRVGFRVSGLGLPGQERDMAMVTAQTNFGNVMSVLGLVEFSLTSSPVMTWLRVQGLGLRIKGLGFRI